GEGIGRFSGRLLPHLSPGTADTAAAEGDSQSFQGKKWPRFERNLAASPSLARDRLRRTRLLRRRSAKHRTRRAEPSQRGAAQRLPPGRLPPPTGDQETFRRAAVAVTAWASNGN
ncbi:mCG14767, partial [Mus musculus]